MGGHGEWECYMVRRHVRSDFASDVFVFPGGKVDEADRDPEARFHCTEPAEEPAQSPGMRALRLAGIRELYEEAGILLAYGRDGQVLRFSGREKSLFEMYRRSVQAGEMSILDVARVEELSLATDRLHAFSHWITPVSSPKRFDTYFFVAVAPEGQEPLHDRREVTAGAWIAPAAALDGFREGSFPLVFATEKQLERLDGYPSLDALVEATVLADLTPVVPRMLEANGETRFLLPGEPGYEDAAG